MHSETKLTPPQKLLHFFLIKMAIGVGVIVLLVALIEMLRSFVLDATSLSESMKALIVAIAEVIAATAGYILLFRVYDKRQIDEMKAEKLLPGAVIGFVTGVLLQAIFVLVIYLLGKFSVVNINPFSSLIGPFAFALTAGFVAEIIIVGVVFRLLEQQAGTAISLCIFIILFAVLHIDMKGATIISVGATAMQAGLMIPAAYVYSRNLWLPIFLHFGWDFAEPGIFGGFNPSTSLTGGLFTSTISGNVLWTGGETGPQDSLSSLLLCLLVGIIFLVLAKQKNNFLPGRWR